jgi:hypothetical protein
MPVSASSRLMAVSRLDTKSFPAAPARSAFISALVNIWVRGSGTFGGRDVRHRGHVELVLTDAPSEELPQPRVVAVLGRGGDLALQPDEEPAHVVGADRGHVIGQALLMEVLGERDGCAGVVVQRLR